MKDIVHLFREHTAELVAAAGRTDDFHTQVHDLADLLQKTFARGNKVLIAGNGGSAAEALHFSDEMLGRYRGDRKPYPVISLTADTAAITCIGNDFGFEHVFRRQVEALGMKGDVFIGLSTSGGSKNILMAVEQAKRQDMSVVALTGNTGTLKDVVDIAVISPSEKPSVIQEFHLHAIHLLCEVFEELND